MTPWPKLPHLFKREGNITYPLVFCDDQVTLVHIKCWRTVPFHGIYYQCYFNPGSLVSGTVDYKVASTVKTCLVSHVKQPGGDSKIQQLARVQALDEILYEALGFLLTGRDSCCRPLRPTAGAGRCGPWGRGCRLET